MREGIIRMLESAGLTVVGAAVDAVDLVRQARHHQPDVIITDIQMPPGRSDDGLRAAMEIRELYPGMGVIVLSQFLEDRYVLDLVGERADGVGYLLKERVADRTILLEAVRSVAAGQSALDRDVIARLVGRRRANGPLDDLTPQERRVLALMAEGRSNTAIADALTVTVPTVERHVSGIFTKLGLLPVGGGAPPSRRRGAQVPPALTVAPVERAAPDAHHGLRGGTHGAAGQPVHDRRVRSTAFRLAPRPGWTSRSSATGEPRRGESRCSSSSRRAPRPRRPPRPRGCCSTATTSPPPCRRSWRSRPIPRGRPRGMSRRWTARSATCGGRPIPPGSSGWPRRRSPWAGARSAGRRCGRWSRTAGRAAT